MICQVSQRWSVMQHGVTWTFALQTDLLDQTKAREIIIEYATPWCPVHWKTSTATPSRLQPVLYVNECLPLYKTLGSTLNVDAPPQSPSPPWFKPTVITCLKPTSRPGLSPLLLRQAVFEEKRNVGRERGSTCVHALELILLEESEAQADQIKISQLKYKIT